MRKNSLKLKKQAGELQAQLDSLESRQKQAETGLERKALVSKAEDELKR